MNSIFGRTFRNWYYRCEYYIGIALSSWSLWQRYNEVLALLVTSYRKLAIKAKEIETLKEEHLQPGVEIIIDIP